ncbi:MAG: imidazole glycerol phosphate synthase subunit HisH [Armatimonadota bacterium]
MIAIVDYGMGNLRSVEKAFHNVGHHAFITNRPKDIAGAERVVLPGVGAFAAAVENLKASGISKAVTEAVKAGKPFLGICLGFQLLFSESMEFGVTEGLGLVPGRVTGFFAPGDRTPETDALKIPHMGWNELKICSPAPLLEGFPRGGMVYFVHSFYAVPGDSAVIATTTRHGIEFCSSIWKDNMFGVQFHPEKSGALGLALLKKFGDWKV